MGNIKVKHLGKAYRHYPSQKSRLLEWVFPFSGKHHDLNWVLQDINFTVSSGEAVGIVGINGAGKSTLLKIITGTTAPTTGWVEMSGTVAAMLELGMGFHPDFSGRQNVFMAGQLLGMQIAEIKELLPEIEEFSEIGSYIDRPVRVYSSGMQMRLAFSVATARRPDILIVDEALSVGDTYFQHKSFDRIRQFRNQGTTLLMVSHDKSAIQSICDRAILLDSGSIATEGEPETVMNYYNAMLAARDNHKVMQKTTDTGKIQTLSGTGEAKVLDVSLKNLDGESVEALRVGERALLEVRISVNVDLPELVLGYMIKDRLGQPVFGTNTFHLQKQLSSVKAGTEAVFTISFSVNLGPGTYSVSIALHSTDTHISRNYEWRDLAATFNVVNVDKPTFVGTAWLPPEIECSL
jgi:lipopolysaccharide transport system ATP-binding protein